MKHLAFLIVLLAMVTQIHAEVPNLFNYSGKLTDKDNNVLPSGRYNMKFILWDHATSTGSSHKVWEEEHYYTNGVDIFGGGYNVVLGGLETLPDFDKPYWLEMIVGIKGKDEKFTRQKMVSTPYAIRTEHANQVADNAITGAKIADRSINGSVDIAQNSIGYGEIGDGAINTQAKAPWAPTVNGGISNPKIAYGSGSTGVNGMKNVAFPLGFTLPPTVTCTVSTDGNSPQHVNVSNITTTGFTANTWHQGDPPYFGKAGPIGFNWMAIGY